MQVGLVAMGIFTARGMGQTQLHWVLLFSTVGWAVEPVLRLSARMTINGVYQAPLSSLQLTSVHQTMLKLMMLVAGVILPSSTSILLSPFSNTLLSTKQELSQFSTEGKHTIFAMETIYSNSKIHIFSHNFFFFVTVMDNIFHNCWYDLFTNTLITSSQLWNMFGLSLIKKKNFHLNKLWKRWLYIPTKLSLIFF